MRCVAGEARLTSQDDFEALVYAGVTLPDFQEQPAAVATSIVKRGLDIVGAGMALVFIAPIMTLLALAIRLETPGPALFRQQRTGLHGRAFTVYKLRTMVAREVAGNAPAEKDDPRITSLGAVLRRLSLDELPQLFNVLRGEMSLVGPRPHATDHDAKYLALIDHYGLRFRTRPGLTGLSQVRGSRGGGDVSEMHRRAALDNRYIEEWSVTMDLKIILMTIPHLLTYKPH